MAVPGKRLKAVVEVLESSGGQAHENIPSREQDEPEVLTPAQGLLSWFLSPLILFCLCSRTPTLHPSSPATYLRP